jgi:hypothetical protein
MPAHDTADVRRLPCRVANETLCRRMASIAVLSAVLAANSGGGHDSALARHQDVVRRKSSGCPQEGRGGAYPW